MSEPGLVKMFNLFGAEYGEFIEEFNNQLT